MNNQESFGVSFGIIQGVESIFFAISYHSHPPEDRGGCELRSGLVITICNASMAIGFFRV